MDEIKVLKPKVVGTTVRDPRTREPLPPEGKAVRMTTFWRRRLADNSVVEVTLAPAMDKEAKPKLKPEGKE